MKHMDRKVRGARKVELVQGDQLQEIHGGQLKAADLLNKYQQSTAQGVWVREIVEDVEAY